jgi:tRNA (guanine37-N1)-methyltransferase
MGKSTVWVSKVFARSRLVARLAHVYTTTAASTSTAASDSFYDDATISAPSYTRPPVYRGHDVPEVLRSGDHARIAAWRAEQAERITRARRPELLEE